ncbi:hypothetical protein ACFO4N_06980 [Camelliibacillus cellulosilyticus]|uniref:Uncharacterized protein n=1 Tax=Camelliibacillus cellulosilyticus TaxID=2174486 RepID=A0ABV9GK47_9BACL
MKATAKSHRGRSELKVDESARGQIQKTILALGSGPKCPWASSKDRFSVGIWPKVPMAKRKRPF